MKLFSVSLSLLVSLTAVSFAGDGPSNSSFQGCADRRAAFVTPCEGVAELVFVKGQCKNSYEFEHVYCAEKGNPSCIDLRAAYIKPCAEGEKLVIVKGQCTEEYEAESFYCSAQ